ncbi:hypothetical protein RZS08_34900, partial [Arthrospira platensis SPKY1]|nr:hypothetical protein [Arthrospira platensis SPKY1]
VVLAFAGERIFRSSDQGMSWDSCNNPGLVQVWMTGEGVLYGAQDNQVLVRSDDEGSFWIPAGLEGAAVYCVCEDMDGRLFAGLYHAGVARRNAEAPEWELANSGMVASTLFRIAMDSGGAFFGLMEPDLLV